MTKFVRTLRRQSKGRWSLFGEIERTKRIRFSFPVPNMWYVNLKELDYENAKDGIELALISSKLMGTRTIAAVSNDFLVRYSFLDIELAGEIISPQWGIPLGSMQQAIRILDGGIGHFVKIWEKLNEEGPGKEGYFRYKSFQQDAVGNFRDEVKRIRKINIPRHKVNVVEIGDDKPSTASQVSQGDGEQAKYTTVDDI